MSVAAVIPSPQPSLQAALSAATDGQAASNASGGAGTLFGVMVRQLMSAGVSQEDLNQQDPGMVEPASMTGPAMPLIPSPQLASTLPVSPELVAASQPVAEETATADKREGSDPAMASPSAGLATGLATGDLNQVQTLAPPFAAQPPSEAPSVPEGTKAMARSPDPASVPAVVNVIVAEMPSLAADPVTPPHGARQKTSRTATEDTAPVRTTDQPQTSAFSLKAGPSSVESYAPSASAEHAASHTESAEAAALAPVQPVAAGQGEAPRPAQAPSPLAATPQTPVPAQTSAQTPVLGQTATASGLSQGAVEQMTQLTVAIQKRLSSGTTKFQLELKPADLGRVDVALTITAGGKVTAHLAFDSPITATTFAAHESELRQNLTAAGLKLDGDALTFSSRPADAPAQTAQAAQAQTQTPPSQLPAFADLNGQQSRSNPRQPGRPSKQTQAAAAEADLDTALAHFRRPSASRLALDLTV